MLDEWALVYLVTKSGGFKGNLFILKVADAMKLCEDDCSHGSAMGGAWCFMWTTIDHFAHMNDTYDGKVKDFIFIKDTGKQDNDFNRLGIQKSTIKEMTDILNSIGYKPKFK